MNKPTRLRWMLTPDGSIHARSKHASFEIVHEADRFKYHLFVDGQEQPSATATNTKRLADEAQRIENHRQATA